MLNLWRAFAKVTMPVLSETLINARRMAADFSVVIGLLKHAFDEAGEAIDGPPDLSGQKFRKKRYKGNPLGKTLYWLKENF